MSVQWHQLAPEQQLAALLDLQNFDKARFDAVLSKMLREWHAARQQAASILEEAAAVQQQLTSATKELACAAATCSMLQQRNEALGRQLQEATATKHAAEHQFHQDTYRWRAAYDRAQQGEDMYKQQATAAANQARAAEERQRVAESDAFWYRQQNDLLSQAKEQFVQQQLQTQQELDGVRHRLQDVQGRLHHTQAELSAALQRAQNAEAELSKDVAAAAQHHQTAGSVPYPQPYHQYHDPYSGWPWKTTQSQPMHQQQSVTSSPACAVPPAPGVAAAPPAPAPHMHGNMSNGQPNMCPLCWSVALKSAAFEQGQKDAEAVADSLRSEVEMFRDALSHAQHGAAKAEAAVKQFEGSGFSTWVVRKDQADKEVVEQLGRKDFWALPGSVLLLMWMNQADTAAVKGMHRLLSKACHPDKNQDDQDGHRKQQSVNLAWDFLRRRLV